MRLSTRIVPGVWLSQRLGCGSCVVLAVLVSCPLLCVVSWLMIGLADLLNKLAVNVIPLWGR